MTSESIVTTSSVEIIENVLQNDSSLNNVPEPSEMRTETDNDINSTALTTNESTALREKIIKDVIQSDTNLDNVPENNVVTEGNLFKTIFEHRKIQLPGDEWFSAYCKRSKSLVFGCVGGKPGVNGKSIFPTYSKQVHFVWNHLN